jgi:hypothetical protein
MTQRTDGPEFSELFKASGFNIPQTVKAFAAWHKIRESYAKELINSMLGEVFDYYLDNKDAGEC